MKSYLKIFVSALLLSSVGGASIASADTIVVLVNKSNPVGEMSVEEVKSIYSGTQRFWEDGSKIKPLHMPPESKEKECFVKNIFKVSLSQYKLFWLSQKQKTGETEPLSLQVSYPILNILSRKKQAIGYVSKADYDILGPEQKANLKAIMTISDQ